MIEVGASFGVYFTDDTMRLLVLIKAGFWYQNNDLIGIRS